jgi:hypothetical protein
MKIHIGVGRVPAGSLWGGDGGKKVLPRMGRGGDGGWGRDNGAGAGMGDGVRITGRGRGIGSPPHCHPLRAQNLAYDKSNFVFHYDCNEETLRVREKHNVHNSIY